MPAMAKYREYTTATGGAMYDDAEVDRILEAVLPLDTRPAYEQVCNAIAGRLMRGHRTDHHGRTNSKFVDRLLWGLATRLREYKGPCGTAVRTIRTGPLTYVERLMVGWAANSNSAGAVRARQRRGVGRPDAAYVARLLGRTEATAATALRNLGPARGRRGLLGD